ncbi:MAG: DNA polymerase III subunit gamma/tau [Opitutales bacterium]|jgi:DNA polymerase-3 subunit delta'
MSSSAATVDPSGGLAARSLQAFSDALARDRLAHAILVHGDHASALETACLGLAGRLLNSKDPARHPDFFALRPSGKARFIRVDPLRDFVAKIRLSAAAGPRKVGVVYEADRMMIPAANAFLKTLEEPPADTTLFLLSTRPNDLLATIRSRCFHLRLPAAALPLADPAWHEWRADYSAWLQRLSIAANPGDKAAASDLLLGAYGLGARFEAILQRLGDAAWEDAKTRLPEGLAEEEVEAIQTGLHKGLRSSLLVELEQATRDFALAPPAGTIVPPTQSAIQQKAPRLARAVADLEKIAGLLEVNIAEAAALEFFLLRSLRHWTAKI